MSMTPAKQIRKYMSSFVGLTGLSAIGGTFDDVTAPLTAVLQTAGDGGLLVPLQAASLSRSAPAMGVIADALNNVVTLYDGTANIILTDGNGHDVYGRVSIAGAVWKVSYFTAPGGVETAFPMPANQALRLEVPYLFTLDLWPQTSGIGTKTRHAAPDAAAYGWREFSEQVTVTGANALSNLTNTPDGRKITLNVNNQVVPGGGASPVFTVAGKVVTWSAANAGFALDTGDTVFATYTY